MANGNNSRGSSIQTILLILIIFLIIGAVVFYYQYEKKQSKNSSTTYIVPVPGTKLIGGCAGTRYGCCPDGRTPRIDLKGSNC